MVGTTDEKSSSLVSFLRGGSLHKCTQENVRGKYRPLSGLTPRMYDACHVRNMHVACRSSGSGTQAVSEELFRL